MAAITEGKTRGNIKKQTDDKKPTTPPASPKVQKENKALCPECGGILLTGWHKGVLFCMTDDEFKNTQDITIDIKAGYCTKCLYSYVRK